MNFIIVIIKIFLGYIIFLLTNTIRQKIYDYKTLVDIDSEDFVFIFNNITFFNNFSLKKEKFSINLKFDFHDKNKLTIDIKKHLLNNKQNKFNGDENFNIILNLNRMKNHNLKYKGISKNYKYIISRKKEDFTEIIPCKLKVILSFKPFVFDNNGKIITNNWLNRDNAINFKIDNFKNKCFYKFNTDLSFDKLNFSDFFGLFFVYIFYLIILTSHIKNYKNKINIKYIVDITSIFVFSVLNIYTLNKMYENSINNIQNIIFIFCYLVNLIIFFCNDLMILITFFNFDYNEILNINNNFNKKIILNLFFKYIIANIMFIKLIFKFYFPNLYLLFIFIFTIILYYFIFKKIEIKDNIILNFILFFVWKLFVLKIYNIFEKNILMTNPSRVFIFSWFIMLIISILLYLLEYYIGIYNIIPNVLLNYKLKNSFVLFNHKKVKSSSSKICTICYLNISNKLKFLKAEKKNISIKFKKYYDSKYNNILTSCSHNFHKVCIIKWVNIKQECPICKRNLIKL